jgi:glycosyltransferase involved in cell wall biosynthesis
VSKSGVISQISYKNPNQLISQLVESTGTEFKMNDHRDNRKEYVKWVKKTYDSKVKNSFLITNSNYSKIAILREYNRNDVIVLSPPVPVDIIISKVKLNQRSDSLNYNDESCILVICRIEPSKRIENVIYLAKLLKERKIKSKINIVGSLEPF